MSKTTHSSPVTPRFVERVAALGAEYYRDLPWRRTHDPYEVLVSEVMLQQTQVSRVIPHYHRWLDAFPDLETLDGVPLAVVLEMWRGLGYNRRAVALKRAAEEVVAGHVASGDSGRAALPSTEAGLRALPGIGPATAAGVRAFALNEHGVYLETNVRTVFLHELFADLDAVSDSEIGVAVAAAADFAEAAGIDARTWNFALLDYGAHLKRTVPNPSRRSAHHTRQSPFEGSHRQKRSRLLRGVMDEPGSDAEGLARDLGLDRDQAQTILEELASEGFVTSEGGRWTVA